MRRFASNAIAVALSAFLVVGMVAVTSAQTGEENEASVTFNDQSSDGMWVEVAEAVLPDGGFVAIHDENGLVPDDILGNDTGYLGSSEYLEPGSHTAIVVWMDEEQEGEHELTAVLYHDDGNQSFDPDENERYSRDGEDVSDTATVDFDEETGDPGDNDEASPTPEDDEGAPAPGIIAVIAIAGLAAIAARRR